ncbi:hypothetical protein J5N97_001597 [Dioscorea zingiberensis]|uniref:U-box domain-containing protein n=1 Tax=Dioscorea zingiberensis TaxID=325984 RepID=A0A9D5H252_9LILI|nr:hypothetical protein J5N97_001597 [Dioscorea zingiberensis]
MRSPVNLCTGVTYDRTSIPRCLDSGNTTCPTNMLPLPSTYLVPSSSLSSPTWTATSLITTRSPSSRPPPPPFTPLFGSDANDDVVQVLALILTVDFIEDKTKQAMIHTLTADLNRSVTALIETLRRTEPEGPVMVDAAKSMARGQAVHRENILCRVAVAAVGALAGCERSKEPDASGAAKFLFFRSELRAPSSTTMASGSHVASTQSSWTSNAHGGVSMSKVIVQYTIDARLHTVFEQFGESKSFDWSKYWKNIV